jgi:prefoldin subunit 5
MEEKDEERIQIAFKMISKRFENLENELEIVKAEIESLRKKLEELYPTNPS